MSKPTWKMSAEELARVFAEHFGYVGKPGGWIYGPEGRPVCQGYQSFATLLVRRGWISVGTGVAWRQIGETPRLPRRPIR